MAGPLSVDDVVSASFKGIAAAQKEYEKLSAEWLWCAPEYFSTVHVAHAIGEIAAPIFRKKPRHCSVSHAQ